MPAVPPPGTPAGTINPAAVPSYVPHGLISLVRWAAGVIGIPVGVVAAQWQLESSFNPNATSPTGAQGLTQIEPATWQGSGCSGNPDNANDSAKCYTKIMYQLVQQYHGNIRDALAAYNAGSANIAAGYGYADQILGAAGEGTGAKAGKGSGNANEPTSTGSGPSQDTCALNIIPGITGIWGGWCPFSKIDARVGLAITIIIAAGIVGLEGARLWASREGITGGGSKGPVGRVVRDLSTAAGPEAAVAGRVLTAPARRRQGRREDDAELKARGASDIKTAQKPIRREIASGTRPPVSPGRKTGSRPAPSKAATARPPTARQRAARAASTGSKPATREEAGF